MLFGSGTNRREQTHMRGSTAGVRGKEDLVVGSERGKAIALSPGLVADTAIASLNIHSGIIMLEEGIMRSSEGRDPSAAAAATVAAATKAGKARDYPCFSSATCPTVVGTPFLHKGPYLHG